MLRPKQFRQATDRYERVPGCIELAYSNERRDSYHLAEICFSWMSTNWSVFNTEKSVFLYNWWSWDLVLRRAKIYFKIFSENSNVGSHLPSLSSTLNLKLYKVSVNSKMAKRVRTTLYLFKASGPNSVPMLVLKNYEPAFS